jgi:hypothetical protein
MKVFSIFATAIALLSIGASAAKKEQEEPCK